MRCNSQLRFAFSRACEIDMSVLCDYALPRELLNDERIRRNGQFTNFLRRQVVERMRRHYQRNIIDVHVLRREAGVLEERGCDNR